LLFAKSQRCRYQLVEEFYQRATCITNASYFSIHAAGAPPRSVKPKTEKILGTSPKRGKKAGKPRSKSADADEQGAASDVKMRDGEAAEKDMQAHEGYNGALSKLVADLEGGTQAQQAGGVAGMQSEAALKAGMLDWTPGLRINMVATETVRNALTPSVPAEVPGLECAPQFWAQSEACCAFSHNAGLDRVFLLCAGTVCVCDCSIWAVCTINRELLHFIYGST
jgi:hypothetical protein